MAINVTEVPVTEHVADVSDAKETVRLELDVAPIVYGDKLIATSAGLLNVMVCEAGATVKLCGALAAAA
jgi:hypothetical protein